MILSLVLKMRALIKKAQANWIALSKNCENMIVW